MEMELVAQIGMPDETVFISHSYKDLWKVSIHLFFPSDWLIVVQTVFLNLSVAISLREGKLRIKPALLSLKIHIESVARSLDKYIS